MKTLGFLGIEIDDSPESSFIVNYINSFGEANPYIDLILFNSCYKRIDQGINRFATIHLNEAKFFTGPVMAFNLKNMLFLKHCIGKKLFYSLRPEWAGLSKNINYQDLRSLYIDVPDVVFVPTVEEAEIFNLCWKEPVVMDPQEYNKVLEYGQV